MSASSTSRLIPMHSAGYLKCVGCPFRRCTNIGIIMFPMFTVHGEHLLYVLSDATTYEQGGQRRIPCKVGRIFSASAVLGMNRFLPFLFILTARLWGKLSWKTVSFVQFITYLNRNSYMKYTRVSQLFHVSLSRFLAYQQEMYYLSHIYYYDTLIAFYRSGQDIFIILRIWSMFTAALRWWN